MSLSQDKSYVVLGAYSHKWTNSITQNFFGSYTSSLSPKKIQLSTGIKKISEIYIGTNLRWSPFKKGFIGLEFTYKASKIPLLLSNASKKESHFLTRVRFQKEF